jgi:hypothetical protein
LLIGKYSGADLISTGRKGRGDVVSASDRIEEQHASPEMTSGKYNYFLRDGIHHGSSKPYAQHEHTAIIFDDFVEYGEWLFHENA